MFLLLLLVLALVASLLVGRILNDVRTRSALSTCAPKVGSLSLARPYHITTRGSSGPGWTTRGTQILTTTGIPFTITGINWYGFETPDFVAHGLYSQDYTTIICEVKTLGYNTIRLPFSNQMWETDPIPRPHVISACPSCQGSTSRDILANIINYAGSIGLHVILDDHRSEAGNVAEDNGLWYDTSHQHFSESRWIGDWQQIQRWVQSLPNYLASDGFPTVLGYDLRDEPHTPFGTSYLRGAAWGAGDGIAPATNPNPNPFAPACVVLSTCHDWRLAAERVADTMLGDAARSGWSFPLFFVEGVSQYPLPGGSAANGPYDYFQWGSNLLGVNGNRTNPGAPVVLNAGGNASALGPATVDQVILNHQLVYSVHDYGPSVTAFGLAWFNKTTCFQSGCAGSSLANVWETHWAYITFAHGISPWSARGSRTPYPWGNTGSAAYSQAPIYLGEFGTGNASRDLTSSVAGSEGQWFTDLVNFIKGSYTAAAGPGSRVAHLQWTYWALNTEESFSLLGKDYAGLANLDKEYTYLCAIQQPSFQVAPVPCTGKLPGPR
jgi:endoglucanase